MIDTQTVRSLVTCDDVRDILEVYAEIEPIWTETIGIYEQCLKALGPKVTVITTDRTDDLVLYQTRVDAILTGSTF